MNQPSIVIQPGDQLLIRVFALDEKGAEYFNQPLGLGANPNLGMMGQGGGGMIGYLVNEMGEIDFPKIALLSITEKRIFVLSINEYPTKEIAGLLGLTSQYVNNARSSIRKKMGIEENWKEVLLNKKNPNLHTSE
jgi:hypothetical protein